MILFLPFISISQNDVSPKIACDLITDYERAKEFTLKYLNTMPSDKYSYKPTPEILSLTSKLASGTSRSQLFSSCLRFLGRIFTDCWMLSADPIAGANNEG